mgnify:FL=1
MIFVKPYIAPPSKSGDSIDMLLDPKAYPKTSTYFKLILKKYYKFPEMKVADFFESELFVKSVMSRTFCCIQDFIFYVEPNESLDRRTKEEVAKYSAPEYWECQDKDAVKSYLSDLVLDPGIFSLTEDKVKYDIQFAWELEI